MNKLLRKIFSSLALILVLGLSVGNTFVNTQNVFATQPDQCDDTFSKTVDRDNGDYNGPRFKVDFQSYDGDSNRRAVISPLTGYQLTFIGIDYDGSDANEATPSVGDGLSNITYTAPNNQSIDNVTVNVLKLCDKVNICHFTSSESNPVEAIRVNDDAFDGVGQNDHTQHSTNGIFDFLFNGPVNPQNQQPLKPEGDAWCEDNQPGDVCNNIPGNQTSTPLGYTASNGVCTEVVDVCTNIPEAQASLPNGYYFASAGICLPQTPVCTDDAATNYDSEVTANEVAGNNEEVCEYPEVTPTDYCPEEGVQTDPQTCEEGEEELTCEEGEELALGDNGIYICIDCEGSGTCEVGTDDPTPTPTDEVTPTVTPTPTTGGTGGPGDGLSDGKSDGRSDGKSDGGGGTVQASTGQVLGASTMAGTGSFVQAIANTALTFGLMLVSLSGLGYAKKHGKKTK